MKNIRIGQGYDVHIFGEGDHIALGGLRLEFDKGVVAHSDGDVVLHALCDAIYGAIAKGDIGTYFPPSDEQWRDAPSVIFLEHAKSLMSDEGYKISNIDITVVTEAPKINPHRRNICQNIADLLNIDHDQVSVKATTHEKMGAFGRGEGLAALANILIYKD